MRASGDLQSNLVSFHDNPDFGTNAFVDQLCKNMSCSKTVSLREAKTPETSETNQAAITKREKLGQVGSCLFVFAIVRACCCACCLAHASIGRGLR